MRTWLATLACILSVLMGMSAAQAQEFLWARQMGGNSQDGGDSVAVDAAGNVYIVGHFNFTSDFDPGPGSYYLSSAGSNDVFISKLDSTGTFVWARRLGGPGEDFGFNVALDAAGNIYTVGRFTGSVDFDPGAETYNLTAAGEHDAFISKLDSAGNFVWARQLGGTGDDVGTGVALDADGNVYTTGFFNGAVDFDPGPGIYNLISAGDRDIFISKLDSEGHFVWARQMGGISSDSAAGVDVDVAGNVYTVGQFIDTSDFDPGPGTCNLTAVGGLYSDVFVSKLDSAGNFVWAGQLGGDAVDDGRSVAVDVVGNVYTTGDFRWTADFDPGPGIYNLTAQGSDTFISKLDSAGDFVWARQVGGPSAGVEGNDVGVDTAGNVYTTGYFTFKADFDPGPGIYDLSAAGNFDIFISKLDSAGSFVRAWQMGGPDYEYGSSLALDIEGNVYTVGFFVGTVDFDPGPGTYNLSSAGSSDVFITKLGPHCFTNADCDDGLFCNGYETCETGSGACLPGAAPICDDAVSCTTDVCDMTLDGCVHAPVLPGWILDLATAHATGTYITTLTWSEIPGAVIYNSYRGTIPPGMMGSLVDGPFSLLTCLESDDTQGNGVTTSVDVVNPPLGYAFYWLVDGENGCGEGPLSGWDGGGLIPNAAPCPTPPP